MSGSRITTMLQTAADPLSEQLGMRASQLAERNRELIEENDALRLKVLELEGLADMDPLLPVYNRRAFTREVAKAQSVMSRYGLPSSILFIDLDQFKTVNDRFGHAVGDMVLERVSHSLLSGVRPCDMVARIGGDEFGVLLFKCPEEVAKAKASSIACRIGNMSVIVPTGLITVTASWGTAACDPEARVADIMDRADREMYRDKRTR